MTLQEMSKDELWEEFVKASDRYHSFTANKHIIELREVPEYKAIKDNLHLVADEMKRRKK